MASLHNFNSASTHTNLEMKNSLEVEPNSIMPRHRDVHAVTIESGLNNDGDAGISLTWEDLWVTVPDGKGSSRPIIQGLTGYARPGQLLAIMGPSGCGKSTLLDALAGRLGANTRQAGDILINGHKQKLAYGTSAYVTQDDTLLTTLTVREAVYYSAQLQLPNSMEMGLQDSENTRIGGWGAKGLSGGQKRRVSICIEILTRPKLLFLDEPTSGLDSAASYYVMSRIARLDQRQGRTIIASIHQPSSEVFELFHNLCLLSSGRTVYFGPTSAANEFFTSNGFPCPTLQNPSDHFLKTINKDFDEDIEEGSTGKKSTEEVISILVKSYKSSDGYQQVQRQVSEICKREGRTLEKSRSHASFLTQCLVLTKRSFVNMYRDLGYYWLRLAIYVALALGLGTIYYDIGFSYSSIQARGAMLAFVASFLTFMTIGGFPSFVEDMKKPNDDRCKHCAKFPHGYNNRRRNSRYAYQGMFKNEYEGLRFASNQVGGHETINGEDVLRNMWEVDMDYSKWVDLAILLSMVVLYRLMFLVIIKTVENVKPAIRALMSAKPKQAAQIMMNPSDSPIHM
ncbi:ABC transporter G family member 11 [Camellia lanceoleosa]|uniref:ABC transporter G family member 11 n=1 Tax=Camellia lanceoleosa TaxID=1840588 RepID=A0ACC0IK40_9ERIC|nr:ABC transporter G family member 11 [Camellia lanceoleosa]